MRSLPIPVVLVVVLSTLLTRAGLARAHLVTFEFSGEVTEVIDGSGVLADDVRVGDSFFGTYTYESTWTDSEPDPAVGFYASPTFGMLVSVGALSLTSGSNNFVEVGDRSAWDGIFLGAMDFTSDGLVISGMVAYIYDGTSAVFFDDALPSSPPPFAAFDECFFQIEGYSPPDGDTSYTINGVIDTLVPEPASFALLAVGAWLFGMRRFPL